MGDCDRKEDIGRTESIILLWTQIFPPCLEELSSELGFDVHEEDIIYGPEVAAQFKDAVEYYIASTEQIIEREGAPRVIVACDIDISKSTVAIPGKTKPLLRTRGEVILALTNLAEKYGTKVVEIDPEKIIELG